MEDNSKSKEEVNLNNNSNKEDSKENNEELNPKKNDEEKKNELNEQNPSNQENPIIANNSAKKDPLNTNLNNEKGKRHRRGKNETTGERNFKCPNCDKCYLSGPALMIHRKLKHNYNIETEKKSRGRPKKEDQQENSFQNAHIKYNEFFNNESRKKKPDNEEKIINLEKIKENLINIFRNFKNDLFYKIEEVENYPFYNLIIDNWDKNNDFPNECLSDNNKLDNINTPNKYNSPPLDIIFFIYLKELSTKTNNEYFLFINKFVVLFREFINIFKKDLVKEEYKNENAKEYSQLFSAEAIPESCNDFFLEFMQQKQYYGLQENELIELAQHFCFWLYSNKFTHSYLTLL